MKGRRVSASVGVSMLLLALMVGLTQAQGPEPQAPAAPRATVGTAFTYQGFLSDGGSPANGDYDFEFRLYDASSAGSLVAGPIPKPDVTVVDGLVSVTLDFGTVYDGTALWLEASVRPGSSTGSYTALSPLQEITPSPYAMHALDVHWDNISNRPAGLDDGDDDTTYAAGTGLDLAGTTFNANTTYLQRRVSNCGANSAIREINADGTVGCETDDNTTYLAGTGLDLAGTTFNANTTYLQRRVSNCGANSAIREINADGAVSCETDDNTTYAAGDGLDLSVTDFSVDVTDILGTGLTESSNDIQVDWSTDGFVKAAVVGGCAWAPTASCWSTGSFNNIGGTPIVAATASTGIFTIDFGFDVSGRYWVGSQPTAGPEGLNCEPGSSSNTELDCFMFTSSGAGDLLGDFMVLVY